MPASKLVAELDAEGFQATWFELAGEYGAKRDEGMFPCNVTARVIWRLGRDGAVSAVRGRYREEGCL
jgi:hypothetical protein